MRSSFLAIEHAQLADWIAKYGSSSATAWLEVERYHIWVGHTNIPESKIPPVQGYMRGDAYIFAWGNPLVSHPSALRPAALMFAQWASCQNMKVVWLCVDGDLATVLGESPLKWSVAQCIGEDVIHPAHVLDLTSSAAAGRPGGAPAARDLRNNLRKAAKEGVYVEHYHGDELSLKMRLAIDNGIRDWTKSRSGIQLASTTFQPWLDMEHRRYWLGKCGDQITGMLILTPIGQNSWSITNAVSFPNAPKGTSETIIYTTLVDLQTEQDLQLSRLQNTISSDACAHPSGLWTPPETGSISVTFGISASPEFIPVKNLSGWKISVLSTAYKHVSRAGGLVERGTFRKKFDGEHIPMFVCFPVDQLGLDGVENLIKCLRK